MRTYSFGWNASQEERATWYPTIIAEMGDVYCGRQARLYYSKMAQDEKPREFVGRDILFLRNGEEGELPLTVSLCRKKKSTSMMSA